MLIALDKAQSCFRSPEARSIILENQLADYYSRPRESERPPPRPLRPCQIDETNSRPQPCSHLVVIYRIDHNLGPGDFAVSTERDASVEAW